MNAILRTVIVLVVWSYCFGAASTYGSIWDSQANPTKGVTIQFKGGKEETGDLWRTFDKMWVLTRADGSARIFAQSDWVMMTTKPGTTGADYWDRWRSWGPVLVITWITVLVVGWPTISAAVRARREQTAL